MKIGILQPGYLPWLGFFEQVYRTDLFVIYDDVNYDKGGWRNRNRIKTPQGSCWLTVPVQRENLMRTTVNEVLINNSTSWRKVHFRSICQNYGRAPYFKTYSGLMEEGYSREWEKLVDIDMFFIRGFLKALGLERPLYLSSDLSIKGDRNERLIKICKYFGAELFYEGKSGENYIDRAEFERNGIQVIYQEYQHPVYSQSYGDFIPYLSVIDLLLNHGEKSLEIIIS